MTAPPKSLEPTTCKECGCEFQKHRSAQNYHSPSCANIAKQRRKRKRRKSAKKSGVALEPQNLAGVPPLEVVSRTQKTSNEIKGFQSQKKCTSIFLMRLRRLAVVGDFLP